MKVSSVQEQAGIDATRSLEAEATAGRGISDIGGLGHIGTELGMARAKNQQNINITRRCGPIRWPTSSSCFVCRAGQKIAL